MILLAAAGAGVATSTPVDGAPGPQSPIDRTAENGSIPNEKAYGIDADTFAALWSGDRDDFTPVNGSNGSTSTAGMIELASGTDIPFDTPPQAVEQWNTGNSEEFPTTNDSTVVYPPNATLRSGEYIKNATVSAFSVQPSTRALISPDRQPLYVPKAGTVQGVVDYRVDVPNESESLPYVSWSVQSSTIETVKLRVNGREQSSTARTQTPTLEYQESSIAFGDSVTFRLTAKVSASVEQRIRRCVARNKNGTCTKRITVSVTHNETLKVNDTVNAVGYDLGVSGFQGAYPNGDLGLVVYKNQPWLGYTLPDGDVHGVWRFYSARDTGWDTLVRRTKTNTDSIESPVHPLQVHAYPIETGPTATRETATILSVYGTETNPPTLPDPVNLDVLTEPYTASYGIASRIETSDHNVSNITVHGLVRGEKATLDPEFFSPVSIRESNLTIEVLNRSEQLLRVKAVLRDSRTGEPINTTGRDGYVVLNGRRVNTSTNGTVIETVPREDGSVSARFVPGHWWKQDPSYVPASDVAYARGTILQILLTLYRIAVPVGLFLLGVYLIDRITGWRMWPPWRGM